MMEETDLKKFIDAQAATYNTALSEVKNGRKRSHWMWFIFPQLQGLGFSETAQYYAIKNLREAEAYLKHPVLGSRLIEICNQLLQLPSNNATTILGSPDDLKLNSSMTLFSLLETDPVFQLVLDKYFNGKKDEKTLQILKRQSGN
ncbi:MAG TPA: DUF1810 domain-containing protein [Segetibacter sp.]|jgi:uncharacterized protein (DUF1810 family)